MSVGVAESGIGVGVGALGVSEDEIDIGINVGGGEVSVGNISALKLQAASNSELITSNAMEGKNLWLFIQTFFCCL